MTAILHPTIEQLRAKVREEDVRFVVPADTKPTRCKGCDAMTYFVAQPSGKLMPVDVLVAGGVMPHPAYRNGANELLPAIEGKGAGHYATCPAADQFRRRP